MLWKKYIYVASGPFLVSRTGDAGSTGRWNKVYNWSVKESFNVVGSWKQQDSEHGGRYLLRKRVTTHLPNEHCPENGWRSIDCPKFNRVIKIGSKFCHYNVSRGLYLLFFETLCVNMCGKVRREQILVVVAINHVWALITDVRKGSMGTVVDHGGAEPKWNVNSYWHFETGVNSPFARKNFWLVSLISWKTWELRVFIPFC